MPKPLLRIVALFLLPSVIADPATASAFLRNSLNPPMVHSACFEEQALIPRVLLARFSHSLAARRSATMQSLSRWENPAYKRSYTDADADVSGLPKLSDVKRFYNWTRPYLKWTPLFEAPALSASLREKLGRKNIDVLVKYEPDQETGSYKPRGVLADVIAQARDILAKKGSLKDVIWVTESTGNHGRALAWAVLEMLPKIFPEVAGINEKGGTGRVRIFVPGDPPIPAAKREALKKIGAEVVDEWSEGRHAFRSYGEARTAVLQLKEKNSRVIHVEHDSPNVMAGHGGILLEIAEQLAARELLDASGQLRSPVTIIAPAGSLGMGAGIALAAQARFGKNLHVVAAQSQNIRGAVESLKTGKLVKNQDLGDRVVLEDGTAVDKTGVRALAVFKRLGHAAVIVQDVAHGVRALFHAIRQKTADRHFEGSVGNAVQVLFEAPDMVDSPDGLRQAATVIVVLSGGNTDDEQWAKASWDAEALGDIPVFVSLVSPQSDYPDALGVFAATDPSGKVVGELILYREKDIPELGYPAVTVCTIVRTTDRNRGIETQLRLAALQWAGSQAHFHYAELIEDANAYDQLNFTEVAEHLGAFLRTQTSMTGDKMTWYTLNFKSPGVPEPASLRAVVGAPSLRPAPVLSSHLLMVLPLLIMSVHAAMDAHLLDFVAPTDWISLRPFPVLLTIVSFLIVGLVSGSQTTDALPELPLMARSKFLSLLVEAAKNQSYPASHHNISRGRERAWIATTSVSPQILFMRCAGEIAITFPEKKLEITFSPSQARIKSLLSENELRIRRLSSPAEFRTGPLQAPVIVLPQSDAFRDVVFAAGAHVVISDAAFEGWSKQADIPIPAEIISEKAVKALAAPIRMSALTPLIPIDLSADDGKPAPNAADDPSPSPQKPKRLLTFRAVSEGIGRRLEDITSKERERIIVLHRAELSIPKISRQMSISTRLVSRILQEYKKGKNTTHSAHWLVMLPFTLLLYPWINETGALDALVQVVSHGMREMGSFFPNLISFISLFVMLKFAVSTKTKPRQLPCAA